MSKEFTDVVFIKVDVDECEDVASEYNISCMPTFLFLKSGSKVIERDNFLMWKCSNNLSATGCRVFWSQ